MQGTRAAAIAVLLIMSTLGLGKFSAQGGEATNQVKLENLNEQLLLKQVEKLEAEKQKLQTEVENLRAVTPETYRWLTVAGSTGAVIGAVVGALVTGLGFLANQTYKRSQDRKMDQEREITREKHNLELFQGLGSENVRVRIASASVLLYRLKTVFREHKQVPKEKRKIKLEDEMRMLVQVLLSILKDEQGSDDERDLALCKHIADNLVKALDLVSEEGHPESESTPSPLSFFDLQNCRLRDVFWKGVNLRGVDLFKADLRTASLRNADLRKAVLLEADLDQTVLRGAKYDKDTLWPEAFDPIERGAIEVRREKSSDA